MGMMPTRVYFAKIKIGEKHPPAIWITDRDDTILSIYLSTPRSLYHHSTPWELKQGGKS